MTQTDDLAEVNEALARLAGAEHTMAPDDPDRPGAITELGRLYVMRHLLTGSGDLDHGIHLLRSVADYYADAADYLAGALDIRYTEREDPADRDEEIAVLEGLCAEFPDYLDGCAADLGPLYLSRLEDDPDQETFERAVECLEHALRQRVPDSEHLNVYLVEAYLLRWGRVPPDELSRLRVLAVELAGTDTFWSDLLLLIDAENATTAGQLRDCATRFAADLFGPYREDKDSGTLAGILAALLARLHGATRPDWSPFTVGARGTTEATTDLLDWLRANPVPADSPDHALFAAGRALLAAHLPISPDDTVAALEDALAVLPPDHPAVASIEYELGRRDTARLAVARRIALLSDAGTRFAPDDPARARCLATLGMTLFSAYSSGSAEQTAVREAEALIAGAIGTDFEAEYRAMLLMALGVVRGMGWLVEPERGDMHAGLVLCDEALDVLPADHPFRLDIRCAVSNLLLSRSLLTRNIDDAVAAEAHLRAIRPLVADRADDDFANQTLVARLLCTARLARITYGDSVADRDAAELDEIIDELATLPEEDLADGGALVWARAIRAYRRGDPMDVVRSAKGFTGVAATMPEGMPFRRTIESIGSMAEAVEAAAAGDRVGVDAQIAAVEARAYAPGTPAEERARHLYLLGGLWSATHTQRHEPELRDKAIAAFEECRVQDIATTEPFRMLADEQLSTLYWARGDTGLSLARGFSALHEHARQVLLHEEVAHGARKAGTMAGNAHTLALRCVAAGQPERAVAAIEGGRALAMQAATSDIGAVLRELGHEDTAAEWERRPQPVGLRYRVLALLEGTEEERRLLSPPSSAAISAALTEIGADALVYLVPAAGDQPGHALHIGADGHVGAVPLPLLGTASEVDRYSAAYRAATTAPEQDREHAVARWRAELDELVRWAWPAVVGPVLAAVSGRVVLVPCGSLGVVPWHAACDDSTGRPRYALHRATFSYVASARQLCDVAARPHRDPAEDPVIVADPTGDLYGSSHEARYLHQHRYPGGLYYGVLPDGVPQDGPGSPEDVLDALPASLLHLSCHAVTGPTPAGSYVELTERLTVTEVLRHGRGSAQAGGLVVLAACASDLTDHEHDEALTLATAFLAAGATGVVGTRWAVDDLRAAVLMCLFHRYLADLPPAEALRAAQLWALDPDRALPADIAEVVGSTRPEIPLTTWAAFSHQGR
jgi:hypothetical protein